MPRWDDVNFDNEKYDMASDNEETRLLKKFEDYKDLEKIEFEKRNSPQITNIKKSGIFGRYLHVMAIIQGIIIVGFSISLIFIEIINSDIKYSILVLTTVALASEVVIISIYLRKKLSLEAQQKYSLKFKNKTEFDGV